MRKLSAAEKIQLAEALESGQSMASCVFLAAAPLNQSCQYH
jgi:hypothetical protein